jgi:hypothetical protein
VEDDEVKRVSWRRLEAVSVVAFGLTMSCVFVGQFAEEFASQVAPSPTQMAQSKPKFNVIDYAETGAIKNATVIIGPCDTRRP